MINAGKTLRLAVSGPTGSGKTSAVRSLSVHADVCAVLEPIPHEIFERFIGNPSAHCYDLQRTIIERRVAAESQCAPSAVVVRDRTVAEDFHVFASMHRSAGLLTEDQFERLRGLANQAERQLGKADAYLLLTADPDVLLCRIRAAGAPDSILNRLDEQIGLYHRWRATLFAPSVIIDTTRLTPDKLAMCCEWVLESLLDAYRGLRPRSNILDLQWCD